MIKNLKSNKKSYLRGSIVINKGDKPNYLFYILKGTIIKKLGSTIIKEYHQSDYFDIPYLNQIYEYEYISKTESNILLIPLDEINITNIFHILKQDYISLEKTNIILSQKTPLKKLCLFIYYKYKEINSLSITIPYTRHQLSDYLSISYNDLKKEIKFLIENNIISSKGYLYNILNLSLLISYTEN